VDNEKRVLRKIYLSEQEGRVPESIWFGHDVGTTREATSELVTIIPEAPIFATPKPERLIQRILQISTKPSDIVLDSFLGSGTSAAVAHKMDRKWIGIELGEHCHTHCIPRLQKVIDGNDQGGITHAVNWKGGGGFKYYSLAPSLLKQDRYGNWIIDERYNANMLAAAMAKHDGFKYMPDTEVFWKQGQSTEKDFIFTTTAFVTVEYLGKIHEEMREDESLLICCRSFQEACKNHYPNITVKKIPNMLLGRCEFGKEDYSLNIVNLPSFREEKDEPDNEPEVMPEPDEESDSGQMNLFSGEGLK
jgi:adenine-specific DNA-methyltransferase